jgi:hypothetical protein
MILFTIDADAREQTMDVSARHALRQKCATPLLEQIRMQIEAAHASALPSGALGKACRYTLTLWPKLTRFPGYPELELSNNLAENSMRPIALGRKNWIHIGSAQAGPRIAAILSWWKADAAWNVPCVTISPPSSPDSPISPSSVSHNSHPPPGSSQSLAVQTQFCQYRDCSDAYRRTAKSFLSSYSGFRLHTRAIGTDWDFGKGSLQRLFAPGLENLRQHLRVICSVHRVARKRGAKRVFDPERCRRIGQDLIARYGLLQHSLHDAYVYEGWNAFMLGYRCIERAFESRQNVVQGSSDFLWPSTSLKPNAVHDVRHLLVAPCNRLAGPRRILKFLPVIPL